jgi:hypothetical protein
MKSNLSITKWLALAALAIFNLQPSTAHAQGNAFTYQGQLQNNGRPAAGIYNLAFSLFGTSTSGIALAGPVTNNTIIVTNGLFTVPIDFGPGTLTGGTHWLEIAVETNGANTFTTLTPRQQLTPAPCAIYAEGVNAAGISGTLPAASLGGTYGSLVTFNNAGNSFSGNGAGLTGLNATTLNGLNATTFWQTTGNDGTTSGMNFLGTTDNQPLEFRVNGQRALRLEPNDTGAPNVIGGYSGNYVTNGVGLTIAGGTINAIDHENSWPEGPVDYSTIGGGASNSVTTGPYSTITGGCGNQIVPASSGWLTSYSSIGGGSGNTIRSGASSIGGGLGNLINDAAWGATIGGGISNYIFFTISGATISGGLGNSNYARSGTIAGGAGNTINANNDFGESSDGATIGGGLGNFIDQLSSGSTIAGGDNNVVEGAGQQFFCGTVGGGQSNQVSGAFSTIPGGTCNKINLGSPYSAIGGGDYNSVANSATNATIAGGQSNYVFAPYGMIPGGANNTAGNFAFAAGQLAQANSRNAFVWGDGSAVTTSTAVDQFVVRASGGVIFYSSRGNTAGVSLAAGSGSWSQLSDCNAKDDFAPITPQEVLAKVAQLPITKWSYKTENGVQHVGPMAQDFYAAFGVGEDNKHITTVDEGGVALAAIQGLNQKLDDKDAEIRELKQSVDELKQLVQSLAERN